MARRARTADDARIDRLVGARVAALRSEKGWSGAELGESLHLSKAHVHALESGEHAFSAPLLHRLAQALDCSVDALFRAQPPQSDRSKRWTTIFHSLQERDRAILEELAEKVLAWPLTDTQPRKPEPGPQVLVLEGIDGTLLDTIGRGLQELRERRIRYVPPDHDAHIWQHLRERMREPPAGPHGHLRILERILNFASEAVFRQESAIRPILADGSHVAVPYGAMANHVFRKLDKTADLRLLDAIESRLFIQPALIVLVLSDPKQAADRAVPHTPGRGQFYSQYREPADFDKAQQLYKSACEDFGNRQYRIHVVSPEESAKLDHGGLAKTLARILKEAKFD